MLFDTHVTADEFMQIPPPVNIFGRDAFRKEVERVAGSAASNADMIAHQMKRTLTERMDEDPALYKKFSELLQEAIEAFRHQRIEELAYLNRVNKLYDDLTEQRFDGVPEVLTNKPEARAYYGVMNALLLAVQERLPELGVLRALGCGAGDLFKLVWVESLLLGLGGAVSGVVVSYAVRGAVERWVRGAVPFAPEGTLLVIERAWTASIRRVDGVAEIHNELEVASM